MKCLFSTCIKSPKTLTIFKKDFILDNFTNITASVLDKSSKLLYRNPNNPICLLKDKMCQYLRLQNFHVYDDLFPIVSPQQNFDQLLIPENHTSRSPTDTFYINSHNLLRTHTTAHYGDILSSFSQSFAIIGDVYRRDAIDNTHYPIFHQLDVVKMFPSTTSDSVIIDSLKKDLTDFLKIIFNKNFEFRIIDAYFPFTFQSLEIELNHDGKWIELLGGGILKNQILKSFCIFDKKAYAFGLGLERLAMILLNISDIRMFWSKDKRFLDQYADGKLVQFKPFSLFPHTCRDISFCIKESDNFHVNDLYQLIREVGGDLIQNVSMVKITLIVRLISMNVKG